MHVLRGRAATLPADRAVTEDLVERVAAEREPAVRVWTPHPHVAFGRRDTAAAGYDRAREAATERGYPAVERGVGGRAVAFTSGTLAFVRATPVGDPRAGVHERYDDALAAIQGALADLGVESSAGEPPEAFCPGSHSLQTTGPDGRARKVAGLAQRVRRDVAVVGGVLVVDGPEAVAAVLDPVYAALGVAFDPSTVGSLARTAAGIDREAVRSSVEAALVGDGPVSTHVVDEAG